jgi:hypothetical protein
VEAEATTGTAVRASQTGTPAAGSSAILATTGAQSSFRTYAITGITNSTSLDSAGVRGVDSSGDPAWFAVTPVQAPAGVLGNSKSYYGVLGNSENIGVVGNKANANSTGYVQGYLGYSTYGVFANGDFGATGTKNFVEPHPTDPTMVIRYVSLEGNEAGTYFRGRGRFVKGRAVIEVPESFRIVTDEEGLTVNVTPIGGFASVAVMTLDLNGIEVQSTRDVEFSYMVQGFRKAYKDFEVMTHGDEYKPWTRESRMQDTLSAEAKRRLIANGTYNADGTVNMATAERVGWAKAWRDHDAEAAKRAEEVNKAMAVEQTSRQQH